MIWALLSSFETRSMTMIWSDSIGLIDPFRGQCRVKV
jgi:hypothetical protein